VKTSAVFFPFDLFGSGGCGSGADLLAEAFQELLADNRRERVPTRAAAYQGQVRVRRLTFESLADYGDWRRRARQIVRQTWRRDDFLLWVTGNHLGVLPIYEELAQRCVDVATEALVIQFDAHLDIHHFHDTTAVPSHGNFLLHADGPLPPIINVGNRDLLLPADYVAKHFRSTWPAEALVRDPEQALGAVAAAAGGARRILLDIDCDVLDPTTFSAVTHPVPFGMSPHLLLRFLQASWTDRVVGVAISEFDPGRDHNDQCLATLIWLVEYLLLKRYEG
jgi:arginase family enzyme